MPKKSQAKRKLAPPYLHASGQYVKKIKGKWFYYGTDKDAALEAWRKQQSYIALDVAPPSRNASPSLAELGNVYADYLRRAVEAEELSDRTAAEYKKSIARLVTIAGADCVIANLRPIDFGAIKEGLAKPVKVAADSTRFGGRKVKRRANTTVAIDIRNLRVFFNWCYKQEHIKAPLRYGDEFSPVSRKALRRKRAVDGPKDLSSKEIRAIIAECKPVMKAIILLGINGAMGNQDIADMKLSELPKLKGEVWLDLPRGKTGAPRRFHLWPETVQALKDYILFRPSPAGNENRDRLFITKNGLAWVRQDEHLRCDSIGTQFAKARKAARVERAAFYDLRRTFRTRAAATRDREAVDYIMGHIPNADDMGAVYNQWIDNDRLKRVTDHVRNWLFDEVTK